MAKAAKQRSRPDAQRLPPLTVSRPEMLVQGSDALFRRLVHSFFLLRSLLFAMREAHGAAVGLSGIEYVALMNVSRLSLNSEPGIQDIADSLYLSAPFATTTINKLVVKKLVAKTVHRSDKRRVMLRLTANGEELLTRLSPMQREVNDIAFEPLSAQEFRLLVDIMQRLVKSTERALALQEYLGRGRSRIDVL